MDMHRHHTTAVLQSNLTSVRFYCLKKDYALEEHICVVKKYILDKSTRDESISDFYFVL